MLAATPVLGGSFTPHCAVIHPSRLVRGLARVVEASGVSIFEQTPVRSIAPGRVETDAGTVRAEVVLRATEGYTPRLQGPAPGRGAGLLADGRDRAALRVDVGVHRAGRPAVVLRRAAPDHLRPAHGRRSARVRRPRCAVPLRLAHPSVVRRGAARLPGPPHRAARDAPAARATSSSPTSGVAASASRATGPPRSGWTGAPESAGQAGTSATGSPPPTSPGAPSPTWSPAPTATWSPCPGSATAAARGSPSRCAGWASTRASGQRRSPTSRSAGPGARAAWRADGAAHNRGH